MSLAEAQEIVLQVCRIVLFAWAAVQLAGGLIVILGLGRKTCQAEIVCFIRSHTAYYPVVKLDNSEDALFFPLREGKTVWQQVEGDTVTVTIPKKGKGVARLVERKVRIAEGILLAVGSAAVACCGCFL